MTCVYWINLISIQDLKFSQQSILRLCSNRMQGHVVSCTYQHFEGIYCLQLRGRSDGVSSMFNHCTWCHIMNPYCHVNLYLIESHTVCKYLCWHPSNTEYNWWLFAGKCCSKTKDSKACSNWEASQRNKNSIKHRAVCLSSQYVVFMCFVLLVFCPYGLCCTLWPLPS